MVFAIADQPSDTKSETPPKNASYINLLTLFNDILNVLCSFGKNKIKNKLGYTHKENIENELSNVGLKIFKNIKMANKNFIPAKMLFTKINIK